MALSTKRTSCYYFMISKVIYSKKIILIHFQSFAITSGLHINSHNVLLGELLVFCFYNRGTNILLSLKGESSLFTLPQANQLKCDVNGRTPPRIPDVPTLTF